MARNPKNFLKKFADINADDVILPECARTAVWEGEQVRVRLDISQYSARDLSGSELRWSLPGTTLKGVVGQVTPKQGDVVPAGALIFEAPGVASNRQLDLQFELVKSGKVVARNHLTLTLFKRASAAAPAAKVYAPDHGAALKALGFTLVGSAAEAEVVVTATLSEQWREHLMAGGKVLWLAETDEAQQVHWGGHHPVHIGPRKNTAWSGDWASNFNWLNQDVMFKDIPTGGRVDFAFADLTPDHVIHGMHPFHFANDVHAGMFLGWVHKAVALVAERRVGRGTLLTSTFRLREQLATHPIAAIMVRDMVRSLG